jgi:hypothetical protein
VDCDGEGQRGLRFFVAVKRVKLIRVPFDEDFGPGLIVAVLASLTHVAKADRGGLPPCAKRRPYLKIDVDEYVLAQGGRCSV